MPTDPPAVRCAHLRAKTMYVSAGASADEDEAEPAVCWCNRTLREIGPDGDPAETGPCSDAARACHEARFRL